MLFHIYDVLVKREREEKRTMGDILIDLVKHPSYIIISLFILLFYIHLPLSPYIHSARDAELIDFFQNAPIAMHWLNGDGTVLWANQTELNVLGYTAEEYIGKPIMNFCPDEKELVLEIFKQLGSGNSIADVPVRFRTKDGRIVHLLIDSNVAYNLDGSFGHTRCFIRDDTARKIRDARVQLLIDENERVRDDTNASFFA